MVVQPRAAHVLVVHREPEGFDQVQAQPVLAASRITLPVFGGISGCDQDDVKWGMVFRNVPPRRRQPAPVRPGPAPMP
jgi:hypothetical protein